jgi:hypothetical protein
MDLELYSAIAVPALLMDLELYSVMALPTLLYGPGTVQCNGCTLQCWTWNSSVMTVPTLIYGPGTVQCDDGCTNTACGPGTV